MKTKTAGPPCFLEALLGRIANRGRGAEILGDLEEEFRETAEAKGRLRAYFHYGRLVLVSLPSFLLDHLSWSRIMIVNDFKTPFRGLRRHAGITLINLAGLALGIRANGMRLNIFQTQVDNISSNGVTYFYRNTYISIGDANGRPQPTPRNGPSGRLEA